MRRRLAEVSVRVRTSEWVQNVVSLRSVNPRSEFVSVAVPMLASPLSTGGAGPVYEFQAAAVVLSKLLRGTHWLGLPVPVARVAMQRNHIGGRERA